MSFSACLTWDVAGVRGPGVRGVPGVRGPRAQPMRAARGTWATRADDARSQGYGKSPRKASVLRRAQLLSLSVRPSIDDVTRISSTLYLVRHGNLATS